MALDVLSPLSVPESCRISASHSFLPALTSDPLQELVQSVQPSADTLSYRMDEVQGHRHCMKVVHISNGSQLMLKISPPARTPLLRHERHCLRTEAFTLSLLAKSRLPIPCVLRYDPSSAHLGSPFLLTTHLPGTPYLNVRHDLTRSERSGIERQLKSLASLISQHTSSKFGSVTMKKGYNTWREAFLSLLESALMDGEDKLVNLPYSQIREEAVRFGPRLDDIKEGRLFIVGLGQPQNVLIDRRTNEVTGLTDFGRAMWGDSAMVDCDGESGPRRLL